MGEIAGGMTKADWLRAASSWCDSSDTATRKMGIAKIGEIADDLDASAESAPLTTLPAERLAEIEANAKGAPSGSWTLTRCDDGRLMVHTVGDVICLSDPNHREPGDEKAMAYLAGLDRDTVLALIAEIRSLARRLGEAEHKVAGLQAGRAVLVQERDEAREEAARLESVIASRDQQLTSEIALSSKFAADVLAASTSQREMAGVLARVVEIAGRNEASPDIDRARRLLAGHRTFVEGARA